MEFNATFLISAISFTAFVIIMNFIFYKPVQKIVSERERFIDNNFDEAKKNNNLAQNLVMQKEQKLEAANFEGKTIMETSSNNAKKQKLALIEEAQKKATQEIKHNLVNLEGAFNETKIAIKADVKDLAQQISKKLFDEKISLDNIDENIAEKIINEG